MNDDDDASRKRAHQDDATSKYDVNVKKKDHHASTTEDKDNDGVGDVDEDGDNNDDVEKGSKFDGSSSAEASKRSRKKQRLRKNAAARKRALMQEGEGAQA